MSRFTERLLAGATGRTAYPAVRPLLTPEMIPEVYRLPEEMARPVSTVTNPDLVESEERPAQTVSKGAPGPSPKRQPRILAEGSPPSGHVGDKDVAGTRMGDERSTAQPVTPPGNRAGKPAKEGGAADLPGFEGRPSGLVIRAEARTRAPFVPGATPHSPLTEPEQRRRAPEGERTLGFRQAPGKGPQAGHDEERSVTVHIGRIEVRAVMPKNEPSKGDQPPTVSLEEYLKRRREKAHE